MVLDILGNKTRRDIIKLVSQEPRYITELKRETGVEKMALARHLDWMVRADILEVTEESGGRGRPRKYYEIRGRKKVRVDITRNHFRVRVDEQKIPEGEGIHDLRIKGAEALADPMERLAALSETADDILREIRLHEEAINRLEGALSRIREAAERLVKEADMDKIDGRILVEIMTSEDGDDLEGISRGIRESSSTVRRHLEHLREMDLVECRNLRWTVKGF